MNKKDLRMKTGLKKLLQTSTVVASMLSAGAVMSATDGSLGATSTGDLDIQVDIEPRMQIARLSDILLSFDGTGTGDVTGFSTACIYRNELGTYEVTASGSGTGSAFTVTNAAPVPTNIPYTVEWDDTAGGAGSVGVTSGTALTGQSGVNTGGNECTVGGVAGAAAGSGVANSRVTVTFARANLLAAPSGTYNGVLTLLVSPE